MTKLWDKGSEFDTFIEQFTTGNDPLLDKHLITYDCIGSIAHAYMLTTIGIITDQEFKDLKATFQEIISLGQQKLFEISPAQEDIHTAIENFLTSKVGQAGKKIHTGRSRNDQIILDLRLYMRDHILLLVDQVLALCTSLKEFGNIHQWVPLAGRTHFQPAMPSSLGLWAGSFLESLLDDLEGLRALYNIINQNPLGSAASYGTSVALDRQLVADLLGFDRVQNNVLYVNNSRGKFESIVLHAMVQIMTDLAKMATDLIIMSTPEFNYVTLPHELCTGSSIMPQKRNPDVLELVRAQSAKVTSYLFQTIELIRVLPSGYNRDFQETKEPLINGFQITLQSVKACNLVIKKLSVNPESCYKSLKPELFATDKALELVGQGIPFRDAYLQVSRTLEHLGVPDPVENLRSKKHQGAPGNLGLELQGSRIEQISLWSVQQSKKYKYAIDKLLNCD